MKVILFETIESLGKAGDLVEVKQGYYRNYLGPRRLAEEATASNLRKLTSKRRILEQKAAEELVKARARAEGIAGVSLTFSMRAAEHEKLFGSVAVADVQRALKAQGIDVERRDILLDQPIKTLGEHEAGVRVHPEVVARIKILVEEEAE